MKISAKAQYACIATLRLAQSYREQQPVHVKAIAEAHGISQQFLVQILLQLKAAGLVESIRGAAGGYQLARAPAQVRLADVINAIDQPPPPTPGALASLPPSPAAEMPRRRRASRSSTTSIPANAPPSSGVLRFATNGARP